MATLKQVSNASKHILAVTAIGVVGILVIIFLVNIVKVINQSLHPTPPAPPTVDFGKLPPISFPANNSTQQFTFALDTLSGSLPDVGDRATIYKIQQSQPSLLALDNATNIVQKVGFSSTPVRISDTDYKWTNSDSLQKTLTMNVFNNNFSISSDFLNDQNVQKGNNLSDQNGAIGLATTFLQNLGLFPQDVDTNKTKATLLSISNGQLVPATSLSDAEIIRVDFFQSDVNKTPIFYPNATYSTMSMLIGGGNPNSQIVDAHFYHQTIDSAHGTYPIISSQQAFDALKKGQAYISSYDNTGTTITIRNISLGYYMGIDQQQYLQPIFVFQGDHGFYAYVPAITAEWIQK